jgi:aldehyde dehydrogenase (NAD+)
VSVMTESNGSLPFIDDNPKELFIDGKWEPGESGKWFETRNPSTGRPLARFASADAADVDRAVAAARHAFEGPWGQFTPVQRQNVLLELADLIGQNAEEFALLDALEMGHPVGSRETGAIVGMLLESLRYYAGWATKIHGETITTTCGSPPRRYSDRWPASFPSTPRRR